MAPLDALQQFFGFDAFRPGQEDAVRAALDGRDVLVVMPTGAGKSLCYQLPALMRDDLTIVVSPLVALMQDQVEALERRAPGLAGVVNAQQDPAVNRAVLERARLGQLRLLYVAPERFSSPSFLQQISGVRVGLFVVDEAHCVSQWGHDFRPDYFRLADAARWLGADAIVASTATATPAVASDIVERLRLDDPVRVSTGFDRPNVSWAVLPAGTQAARERRLVAALSEPGATPAIVYAGTRAATDELAALLREQLGRKVVGYHAGLSRDARAAAQRQFMDGEVDVVVATNAFGMGVDKADVRTVVHATVPASLEAWYQEAGRGGRDGLPSRALLLPGTRDKSLHRFFIEQAAATDEDVESVARTLLGASVDGRFDVGLQELRGRDGELGGDRARAAIGYLARAGVLQPAPSTVDRVRGRALGPFDGRARAVCRTEARGAEQARWRQYHAMWAFVEATDGCRRERVLGHFGDPSPGAPMDGVPCCDLCAAEAVPASVRDALARAKPGTSGATDLDGAIVEVVGRAEPAVGRTRVVEILRGSKSQAIRKHSYDGLPEYGTFDHLSADDVLGRVDALIDAGRLRKTGGAYPTLRVQAAQEVLA